MPTYFQMPRLKSSRRSQAAKLRAAGSRVGHQRPGSARFAPAGGTGDRHRVQKWPISSLTGRQHKLVVPAESPDKEFVLLVGASHLRSIVDGIVKMPEGRFSFGAMCTPGACATQLRTEAANTVLPRTPDAVCVMAPSNNLTSSRTITEAGEGFGKLLATAISRWSNVFALDFVPRLTVDPDYRDMMRQEFRRVAARMGVKYTPIAEYFPSTDLDLWSRDGVHLSDSAGMPILKITACQESHSKDISATCKVVVNSDLDSVRCLEALREQVPDVPTHFDLCRMAPPQVLDIPSTSEVRPPHQDVVPAQDEGSLSSDIPSPVHSPLAMDSTSPLHSPSSPPLAFARSTFDPEARIDVVFVDIEGVGEGAVAEGGHKRVLHSPHEADTGLLDLLTERTLQDHGPNGSGVPATGVGVAAFLVSRLFHQACGSPPTPARLDLVCDVGLEAKLQKIAEATTVEAAREAVGEALEELSLTREELLAAVLHHHCDGRLTVFIEDTTPLEAEDIHRAFGVSSLSVEGSNRRRWKPGQLAPGGTGCRQWRVEKDLSAWGVCCSLPQDYRNPCGGLSLTPTLNVLHPEDGQAQFPTANTCAFVLRLPVFGRTQASAKHLQAFLIDGLGRWNEDRAAAASGEVEPLHSDSGHLKHALNQKSQRVLGRQLVKDFTKPAEYTGELIGVEFLYRQTGKVLEDVGLDPDIPDEAAAIQSLEEVDEGIEEDVEDPTVFQPDIPSTSAAARSGDPADAPRSEPSGPAAPHQPDPPEAPEAPAQQSSSEEMQGLDGQPGYQHVLKLAKALLEARSLQGLSDKRVDELMALWQRLPEPDRRRVVYPPRHRERQPKGRFKTAKGKNTSCPGKESLQRASRLVEAICSQLCRLHPTATRFGGIMRTRWFLILTDYVAIREARTLSQWFSRCQKDRGCLCCCRELASSLQQLWLSSLSRQRKGCPSYRWDKDSPSITTSRRCRDLQGWFCLPHLATSPPPPLLRSLLPTVPLMAAPAAQPPPLRVPTAYRKRKAAEADAARGGPSPWSKARQQTGQYTCRKCGQAERIDTLATLALQELIFSLKFPRRLHAMSVLSAASERTEREREAEGSFIELVGVSYSEHSFIVYHGTLFKCPVWCTLHLVSRY
ncbi:hypothetical protein KUCAC02_009627 [Chaenocephalus aceratus]|nr:hypothetical protein KUCAC02_009627 [Chaenocephalus aceratus]